MKLAPFAIVVLLSACAAPSAPPVAAASTSTLGVDSAGTGDRVEASAADRADCPWRDTSGVLRLGRYALETPVEQLPATLQRLPGCIVQPAGGVVDCELRDSDGVAYLADQQGLIRIEARAGEAGDAVLPLGLRWGNTRDEVAARLQTLPAGALRDALHAQLRAGGPLATGFCVIHGAHDPASWYIDFDADGRLARTGLRLNAG